MATGGFVEAEYVPGGVWLLGKVKLRVGKLVPPTSPVKVIVPDALA